MDVPSFVDQVMFQLSTDVEGEVIDRGEHFAVVRIEAAPSTPLPPRGLRRADITYTGSEMFLLDLDDRFTHQDSAIEDADQEEVIESMVAFAYAYVKGEGQLSVKKGAFGRTYEQLDIAVQEKRFRVKSGPFIPTWNEVSGDEF